MKRTYPRKHLRSALPVTAALALAVGLSACGAANESSANAASASNSDLSGTVNIAGASSQEAAVAAWQKGFQTQNSEVTVNYDPAGSGAGREQFIAGGVPVAGSDAYLEGKELEAAKQRCDSDVIEVPVYVSPIALIYHVEGVDELNLSPATAGAIFAGEIDSWNDPEIKAENPDADLPDTRITPVHRSDDSGTTENFTDYLDQAAGGAWTHGAVETWPINGGEAATGTSGVVAAVKSGAGTIGYADASQAGDLGVANIKVGKDYVSYSPEAAAAVLDASELVEGRSEGDLAIAVDRKSDAEGVYPIVLVSYQIACSEYQDAEQAKLVSAWLSYISSDEGQRAAADGAGSAPISDQLASKITPVVESISVAG